MIQKHFVRISVLCLLSCLLISAAYAGVENQPQVDVSFEKTIFGFNETVPVRVSISNAGKSEIKILRWLTPFDGVKSNLFSVTLNGVPVEYTGAVYKRAAPVEADYLTLKAGETVVEIVNLADFYDFSKSGLYSISFRAESANLFSPTPNFRQTSAKLESESVAVWVNGTPKKLPPDNYTTTGCDATQTAALPPVASNALGYAVSSHDYLNAGTVNARYTTWFGVFDTTRYATVRTNFLNIRTLLNSGNYRIGCNDPGCSPGVFAFVFPSDTTHTIYVCSGFWSAPTTGTDSKAGVLIHETSHFNDIAMTQDFAYGQAAAMALAVSNPANAVNNADNHEYFAEAAPPTAAGVSISGRVLSPDGFGISNANVILISASGAQITTRSSAFGYYRFDDLGAGQTYVLSANSKGYVFAQRAIYVNESLSDVDLTGVSP